MHNLAVMRLETNARLLAIGNLGGAVLSFGLYAVIGRMLGDTGLGVYAAALAYAYPASILVEFGLGTLIIRDAGGDLARANELMRLAVVQRVLMGGLVLTGLIVGAVWMSADPLVSRAIVTAAPLVVITPLFGVFTSVIRVSGNAGAVALLNLMMLGAQFPLTLLVLAAGGDVVVALAVNTLTSALQALAAWAVWRRSRAYGAARALPTRVQVALMMRRAVPLAIGGVLAALAMRLPFMLTGALGDMAALGVLTAAWRFTDAAKLIPNALYNALLPAFAAAHDDPQRAGILFRREQRRLLMYGVLAGAGLALGAPLAIGLAFGADFSGATAPLVIMGAGLATACVRGGVLVWHYAADGAAAANRAIAAGLLLTAVVCAVCIPVWGAAGAAIGVVAGDVLTWLWARPRRAAPSARSG
jgi:O-antigen/teichoic acid export membrane protein